MKKLSFGLVALLAIVFAVSSSFTVKNIPVTYHVYGVIEVLEVLEEQDWEEYIPDVPNQVEIQENPSTSEAAPFNEEPAVFDFAEFCQNDPERVCLLVVKKQDDAIVEIVAILDGEFQN